MAVAVREQTQAAVVAPRRFSIEEYERIHEIGIIAEDERVELMQGEIVEMAAIGIRHANTVSLCTDLLGPQIRPNRSWGQNPIILPTESMPQPDYAVLHAGDYSRVRATAADVLLIMEVSDSSKRYDLTVKFPLYAAAGIPEAWLIDLIEDRIQRHNDPGPSGYRQVMSVGRGDTLSSLVLPSVTIAVDDVLGPPAT